MTDRKQLPNTDILKELFHYNEKTGELIRKTTTSSNAKKGDIVLGFCKKGYRRVRLFGENHYAHRIAWKIFYNQEPPEFLDHVNRDKSDNRIENLRFSNPSLNGMNRKKQSNNTSGFTGVTKHRSKWAAGIRLNGKQKSLGVYENKQDAINARKNAEIFFAV